jgi:hypothetical protein
MARKENGRITTREFYFELMQIKPQLQKIDSKLEEIQQWATGENGVECRLLSLDDRLDSVEKRHAGEDARSTMLRVAGRIINTLLMILTAVASAVIGALLT